MLPVDGVADGDSVAAEGERVVEEESGRQGRVNLFCGAREGVPAALERVELVGEVVVDAGGLAVSCYVGGDGEVDGGDGRRRVHDIGHHYAGVGHRPGYGHAVGR